MNKRIIAALVAIVILAAGCGAADNADSQTAQQIEDLQARIEQLNDADDTSEAVAEPDIEPATTEAPTTTSTTTTTTTTTPPSVSVLDGSLGPDEFMGVVVDIAGPTDDISAQIRRVDPEFVDLVTPADATITGASTFIRNIPGRGFIQEATLIFTTSVDPLQVVDDLESQLLATFPAAPVERSQNDRGNGTLTYSAEVGDYSFNAFEDLGSTSVWINKLATGSISVEEIALFDGVTTALTPPPGATLDTAQVSTTIGGPRLFVSWHFPGLTADEGQSLVDTYTAQNGLAINVDGESYIGSQTLADIELTPVHTSQVAIDRGHEDGMFLNVSFIY